MFGALVKRDQTWQLEAPFQKNLLASDSQQALLNFTLLGHSVRKPRAFAITRVMPATTTQKIQATQSNLQQQVGSQDVTPQLYLLAALAEYGQYQKCKPYSPPSYRIIRIIRFSCTGSSG
jgi:hypothetical protein